jgi:hypothetical protein
MMIDSRGIEEGNSYLALAIAYALEIYREVLVVCRERRGKLNTQTCQALTRIIWPEWLSLLLLDRGLRHRQIEGKDVGKLMQSGR